MNMARHRCEPGRHQRRAGLRWALIAGALLVTGCGSKDTDPGPGGVTVAEAKALDEAAEMIEAQRLPADALETGTAAAPAAPESGSPAPAAPAAKQ